MSDDVARLAAELEAEPWPAGRSGPSCRSSRPKNRWAKTHTFIPHTHAASVDFCHCLVRNAVASHEDWHKVSRLTGACITSRHTARRAGVREAAGQVQRPLRQRQRYVESVRMCCFLIGWRSRLCLVHHWMASCKKDQTSALQLCLGFRPAPNAPRGQFVIMVSFHRPMVQTPIPPPPSPAHTHTHARGTHTPPFVVPYSCDRRTTARAGAPQ